MPKKYLDEEGLQIVANKVNKKQDSFITGKSLEFVTIGQGQIDGLLYLGANNELVTTSPEQSITVDIVDADKALGLANQLVQIQTQGFIGGCSITINSLSPQTSVGAVEGDILEPTQSENLFPSHDSFSAEFREWCQTYGVSIMPPLERSRILVFYISVPQLSINTALDYVPDDTQTTVRNSWSASYTKSQIKALSPVPLVSSDTAAIVDDTVDTWGMVDGVVDSNDEPVETYPDVTDGFLLQKFLWNSTPGAEQLPQTMTVNLRWVEIYYGYFGIRVTCNGTVIGQTIYPLTQGSEIFENNIGITWDYWTEGTYTVSFTNSETANVQKVEVNGAIDEEARETAAGAIGLAQQTSEELSDKIGYVGEEVETTIHEWNDVLQDGARTEDIILTKDGWYFIQVLLENSAAKDNNAFTFSMLGKDNEYHTLIRQVYNQSGTVTTTHMLPLKAGTYHYSHSASSNAVDGRAYVYMNRREMV